MVAVTGPVEQLRDAGYEIAWVDRKTQDDLVLKTVVIDGEEQAAFPNGVIYFVKARGPHGALGAELPMTRQFEEDADFDMDAWVRQEAAREMLNVITAEAR